MYICNKYIVIILKYICNILSKEWPIDVLVTEQRNTSFTVVKTTVSVIYI